MSDAITIHYDRDSAEKVNVDASDDASMDVVNAVTGVVVDLIGVDGVESFTAEYDDALVVGTFTINGTEVTISDYSLHDIALGVQGDVPGRCQTAVRAIINLLEGHWHEVHGSDDDVF